MEKFQNLLIVLWILTLIGCYEDDPSSASENTVPVKPDGLQAVALSTTEILITWVDNSTNEDAFIVEAREANQQNFTEVCRTNPNIRSFTLSGCTPCHTYFFRVFAYNSSGNSDYSEVVSVSTPDLPPFAPSNLRYNNLTLNSVELIWSDNSDNEDGFRVDRKLVGEYPWEEIGIALSPDTTYEDEDLLSGREYYYKVRAYNIAGVSPYSNRITIKTLTIPNAPTGLWIDIVSDTRLKLYWRDNSSNEDGFSIERKTEDDTSWAETARYNARHTIHTETGLLPNTTYTFRLRAFNTAGYSDYSNEATARTPGPPAAPEALTATVNSTDMIELSWTDNSINETGFGLYTSIGDTMDFELQLTFPENTTSAHVTDDILFTDFYYRMLAFNDYGSSGWSNTVSANTKDPIVFLGGLKIIDVSTPQNPSIIHSSEFTENARDILISGNRAFIAADNDGLIMVDISDKFDPSVTGEFQTNSGISSVQVKDNYAYIAGTQSGFRILDISSEGSIAELGFLGSPASSIFLNDRHVFLASTNPALKIIDVIAPTRPVQIGSIGFNVSGTDIFVTDQYAYLTTLRHGLKVYRISDPTDPFETGVLNLDLNSIFASGDYAYATSTNFGLHIIDISIPSNPHEVGRIRTPGNAWDVYVLGDYAYVADYSEGLQVIDVSDPTNPFLLGSVDTNGFERCVWVVEY